MPPASASFVAGGTREGEAAADTLSDRLPEGFEMTGQQRDELIDFLRDRNEGDLDDEEIDDYSDEELASETLLMHLDNPEHTIDGEEVQGLRTGEGEVKTVSEMVSRSAIRRLAASQTSGADTFSARDIVHELKNWHRFQQGEAVKTEGLSRSLRAYDPRTDSFSYDNPPDHSLDAQQRSRGEALVRAQYQNTQKELSDLGITEVTVYRGMGWHPDSIDWPEADRKPHEVTPAGLKTKFASIRPDTGSVGPTVDDNYTSARATGTAELFAHSPVGSFSTSENMARQFAMSHGEFGGYLNGNALVVKTTVPASAVLAVPTTGCAYFAENEVLIHGGTEKHAYEMEFLKLDQDGGMS